MSMSIPLLAAIAVLIILRLFWSLYQAYSKQRLRRRVRNIHLQDQ